MMRSHEVHNSASDSEEGPITMTRCELASIVQKIVEEALAQGGRKSDYPPVDPRREGEVLPYARMSASPALPLLDRRNGKEVQDDHVSIRTSAPGGVAPQTGGEEQTDSCATAYLARREPSAFTEEIMLEELPTNFRAPHLREY